MLLIAILVHCDKLTSGYSSYMSQVHLSMIGINGIYFRVTALILIDCSMDSVA